MSEDGAKGNLPTVAGVLQAAANSKPGSALLGPAAEAFGKYFGEIAAELTDRWRDKRKKNLEDMKARVVELDGQFRPNEVSERQAILAIEWAESAQTTDPHKDEDAAALWQALLAEIVKDTNTASAMLNALKQLEAADAEMLLRDSKMLPRNEAFRPRNPEDKYILERLKAAGLMSKTDLIDLVPYAMVAIAVFVIYLLMLSELADRFIDSSHILAALLKPWSIAALVVLCVGVALPTAKRYFDRYNLTSLGYKLREQGIRYKRHSQTTA